MHDYLVKINAHQAAHQLAIDAQIRGPPAINMEGGLLRE